VARKKKSIVPSGPSVDRTPWWYIAILVVAATVTYANTIGNAFVLDDEGAIVSNEQIRSLLSPAVLNPERELQVAGRPIANITLAVNYVIGGLDPVGYHVVNIAIHLLCGLLVFAILRRLLRRVPVAWLADAANGTAFAIALLWVVHPLNSEAVDYLTQRTESLMALFYLLTTYAGLRALDAGGRLRWSTAAVIACALGMGSKESMATAPLTLALVDRTFVFDSWRAAIAARWRLYAGLASTWLVLAVLMATDPRGMTTGTGSGVSVWMYLLNQAPLVVRYVRLAFWPNPLVANYGWPVPLTLGDVWPAAALVVACVAATIALLWRAPRLGFVCAWFFVTLAPASSVIPIATEVGAERRMYLPSLSLIALAVLAVLWMWRATIDASIGSNRPRAAAYAGTVAVAAVALTLMARTMVRNDDYRTPLSIAEATVAAYPTPNAHHVLAEYLLTAGRRDEALQQLHAALPGAPRAHYTLGVELFKDGKYDEAIAELQAFVREQPRLATVIDAHGYLGEAFAAKGNLDAAADQFEQLLKITPDNPAADHSLADILMSAQRFDQAVVHYRRYLAENPNDADALNRMGLALGATGHFPDALSALQKAAAIDPSNGEVQHNLALALYQMGDLSDAVDHARRDVELQPANADSRELLQGLQSAAETRQGRGQKEKGKG